MPPPNLNKVEIWLLYAIIFLPNMSSETHFAELFLVTLKKRQRPFCGALPVRRSHGLQDRNCFTLHMRDSISTLPDDVDQLSAMEDRLVCCTQQYVICCCLVMIRVFHYHGNPLSHPSHHFIPTCALVLALNQP